MPSFGSSRFQENAMMESALLKEPDPGTTLEKTAGRLSAQSKDYSSKFPKIVIENN